MLARRGAKSKRSDTITLARRPWPHWRANDPSRGLPAVLAKRASTMTGCEHGVPLVLAFDIGNSSPASHRHRACHRRRRGLEHYTVLHPTASLRLMDDIILA